MSGLAQLLIKLGYQVSASDSHSSPYLDDLATNGAETWVGSHPEKIRENSIIFYSTAIPKNDPERIHAQKNNIQSTLDNHYFDFLQKNTIQLQYRAPMAKPQLLHG